MSKIIVTITNIENIENLNIVKFDFLGNFLTMMSLELNQNIKIGTKVILSIKPSHISISKNFKGLVSSNQLLAKVKSCNNGKLLSSLTLLVQNTIFESLITAETVNNMDIKVGDEILMLINPSEISIREVIYD